MSFTVFLGNLPTWVTADDIKQWLAAEDLVADAVKVIRNHETQESKGFAFVEAPTSDEMQSIIRRFDRAPLEDRLLRANPAQPPKGKDARAARTATAGSSTQCHSHPTASRPQEARRPRPRADAAQRFRNRAGESPVRTRPRPARVRRGYLSQPSTPVNGKSHPLHCYPSLFSIVIVGTGVPFGHGMKYAWLGCLLVGGLLFAGTQDSDLNVNTRYTVETVIVLGKGLEDQPGRSTSDQTASAPDCAGDLAALIGQKLNPGALDELAKRLRKGTCTRATVDHRVLRGETPEHVRVEFEVTPAARGST